MIKRDQIGWILKTEISFLLIIFWLLSAVVVSAIEVLPKSPVTIDEQDLPFKTTNSRIAANSQGYLSVWLARNGNNDMDIFGRFADPNGEFLGDAINITPYISDQKEPDIDSDGNNFLVVWSDGRGSNDPNLQDTGFDIYGAVIDADGFVGEDFIIERAEKRQAFPKVKWNGKDYLVVWEDWNKHDATTGRIALRGVRVNPNGQLIDTQPKDIVTDFAFNKKGEKASYDITSFEDPNLTPWFIVWSGNWQDPSEYGLHILGEFISEDPNGHLLSTPFPIQIPTPFSQYHPVAESIGNNFLVVWESARGDTQKNSDIHGVMLGFTGNILGNLVQISLTEGKQKYPEVASNGQGYFVIWVDQTHDYIYGVRISPEGLPLADPSQTGRTVISSDPNRVFWYPDISSCMSENGSYFCIWSSQDESLWSTTGRIYYPPPPPKLDWVDSNGFRTDGVDPDSESGGSPFDFKVKYISDKEVNLAPEIAEVWIDLDDSSTFETGEKFEMTEEEGSGDSDYSGGRVFAYHAGEILYDGDGELYYRFFFMDKYNVATGKPNQGNPFQVGMVGDQPVLYWAEVPGFTEDGARPDGAAWIERKDFEFRVSYEDSDSPESLYLYVDKDADGLFDPNDEIYEMDEIPGGNGQQRRIFVRSISLGTDTFRPLDKIIPVFYKFEFDDGKNKAIGEPRAGSYISFNPIDETSACLNMQSQFNPSIIYTGKSYQVFWEDYRERQADPNHPIIISHIWMELLSGDGLVKDNPSDLGQVKIDAGNKGAFKPHALFDNDNQRTLLTWEDLRSGSYIEQLEEENLFKPEYAYKGLDIYGIFVDAGGNILKDPNDADPNSTGEFIITGSGRDENMLNPDTALGPNGQYLVVYEDESQMDTDLRTDIFGMFVRYPDGAYGNRIDLRINIYDIPGDAHQTMPRVAWNGEYYMVVWQDIYSVDYSIDPNIGLRSFNVDPGSAYYSKIYGVRVDPDGDVYPQPDGFSFVPPAIEDDQNISQYFPDIASDGENFLIVWQDNRFLKTFGYNIYGMRVNSNGGTLDYDKGGEIPICIAKGHQIRPRVFWDPQAGQYIITWIEMSYDLGAIYILYPHIFTPFLRYGTIKAVRMSPDGELLDGPQSYSGTSLVGLDRATQDRPDMYCDPNMGCRTVWEDIRNTSSMNILLHDLYTTSFSSTLNWTDDPNFVKGVQPYQGSAGGTFKFQVLYRDRTDKRIDPNNARLWIDLDDDGVFAEDEKFKMDLADPNKSMSQGALFTYSKKISLPKNSDGIIDYRFYFENDDGIVKGEGSNLNHLYLEIKEPPELDWTYREGFITDGVNPDEAESGSEFRFSVTYFDRSDIPPVENGRAVLIDIDDSGDYSLSEWFRMSGADPNDDDFSDGKEYTYKRAITFRGDGIIKYRFYFNNGIYEAEGEPASDHTFRVTKPSSPVTDLMWRSFYKEDGLAENFITALDVDNDNILWAGCINPYNLNTGGVSRFDGEDWDTFKGTQYLPGDGIIYLSTTSDNHLWVITLKGISHYNGQSWGKFPFKTQDIDPNNNFIKGLTAMASDNAGGIWLGLSPVRDPNTLEISSGKLVKYESGTRTEYSSKGYLGGNYIRSLAVGKDGLIWASVEDNYLDPNGLMKIDYKGIILFDPEKKEIAGQFSTDSEGGYPGGDYVYHIYRDDTGDMWIASFDITTQTADMSVNLSHYNSDSKTWEHHYTDKDPGVTFGSNQITSIYRKGDEVWLGHYPEYGYSGDQGTQDYYAQEGPSVQAVSPGGATYHNLSSGQWRLFNSQTDPVPPAFDNINDIVVDQEDIVWFGSSDGLFRYNSEGIIEYGEVLGPYKGFFDLNEETGCFINQTGSNGIKTGAFFLLGIFLFLTAVIAGKKVIFKKKS